MSAGAEEQITTLSPTSRSRTIGIVYFLYFVTAISTLALGNQPRLALAANLSSVVFYAALAALFYKLFKPVNRSLSLVAALVSLAGCAVQALALLHVHFALKVNPLVFFGPYCILLGYLVLRCVFLPRILGALMSLAGIGWLLILLPQLAKRLLVPAEAIGFLAELLLCLWLLVFGANIQRTNKQQL